MKASEVIDIINQVEDVFPVDEWKVNGIHVWPVIRIQLKYQLFQHHLGLKATSHRGKLHHLRSTIFSGLHRIKGCIQYPYAFFTDFKILPGSSLPCAR